MDQKKNPPVATAGNTRGVTVSTTTQPAQFTGTKRRYKCPVHGGSNLSVAVGYIDGRAWAKCWSQGCSSEDILAALGITSSQPFTWTPPPPRLQPAISVNPLPPVSHTQALDYLLGIRTPEGSAIQYQRNDGLEWAALEERHQAEKPRCYRRRLAAPPV